MNKALFLDRDGVINIDTGHLFLYKDVVYVEHIFNVIKVFKSNDYLVFVITNQAGIEKNYYTKEHVIKLHKQMSSDIFSKTGFFINEWFFCPHKENDNCKCRKPNPLMIQKAIKKYNIDPSESYLIGDKISDVMAGYSAGVKHLFLLKSRYFNNDDVNEDFEINIIEDLSEFPIYNIMNN